MLGQGPVLCAQLDLTEGDLNRHRARTEAPAKEDLDFGLSLSAPQHQERPASL
jgi:hypothetical protein